MKRGDPKLIGGFVVGAVVLAVVGLIFFGRGGVFTERSRYILYFDHSVSGLAVGAPVLFRGVKIGSVDDISVHVRPGQFSFKIPVVITIDPGRIEEEDGSGGLGLDFFDQGQALNTLISKGLRGQLQLQSLVTGQLFVQLDMHPGTEAHLTRYKSDYPEIPTIPSGLQQLTSSIEKFPIDEVVKKLVSTLDGLQELVHNPDLADSLFKFNHGLDEIRAFLARLERQLGPALENFDQAAVAVQESADSVQASAARAADRSVVTMTRLETTLDHADQTFDQASAALGEAEKILQDNTHLGYRVSLTLDEVRKAGRALRQLAETLERHPDALLRGKEEQEEK